MDRTPTTIDSTATRINRGISTSAQQVLRKTYLLLSATLLWSAAVAGAAMAYGWPYPGGLLTIIGFYGLFFAVQKLRNSAWSVPLVFALTGFMGYTLGPVLSYYVRAVPDGGSVILTALASTGGAFLALSAYAVTTRKSFSFMGSFLFVGSIIGLILGIVAMLFHLEALSLAVAGMFTLISSGMILWQTGEIVNGGETNYVLATVSLYVSIYNLFVSLLRIFAGSRN
jgi:modulator of FtsH protease